MIEPGRRGPGRAGAGSGSKRWYPTGQIRVLAWALAGFFLVHALVSFRRGLGREPGRMVLHGPGGLVIGLLVLIVAGSGGAWRIHRPRQMLPSR